jgi:hypothetical protein
MNHRNHTAPAAAALVATLLLVTGGTAGAAATAAPHRAAGLQPSTPCLVTADLVDHDRQAHQGLPDCARSRLTTDSGTTREPCLVVADRIEQFIALGLELPDCVRRLQEG